MLREVGAAERTRVWTIDLGNPVWDGMAYTLTKQEFHRVESYKSLEARRRFQRRRIALRAILAHCQDLLPEKVALEFDQFGKPRVSSAQLFFNASHSRDVAIVATCSIEVGIDIEFVCADFASVAISSTRSATRPNSRCWPVLIVIRGERFSSICGPAKRPTLRQWASACGFPSLRSDFCLCRIAGT